MNPQESNTDTGINQETAQQSDFTPEDAKAALGNSSYLVEQMLMSQMPQQAQEMPPQEMPAEQSAQLSDEEQKRAEKEEEKRIDDKIEEKVTAVVQKELTSFKEDLMKALNDEEE
jgi:CRISPR/Cas system type I-B associated protein Csh2 (Cas7 group RAMP superfamily)